VKSAAFILALLCALAPSVAAKRKPKTLTQAQAPGPTLPETTAYIVQILNADGKATGYSGGTANDSIFSSSLETLNARSSGCQIYYEMKETSSLISKGTSSFDTKTYGVALDLASVIAGSLEGPTSIPGFPIFTDMNVHIRLEHPLVVTAHRHEDLGDPPARDFDEQQNMSKLTLPARDWDTGSRLANALRHAIDLCGGGKADPFRSR